MPDTPRAIRVPDKLWEAALRCAQANEDTVSNVVRQALERYIAIEQSTATHPQHVSRNSR
jgi:predicted transcriptional regulator